LNVGLGRLEKSDLTAHVAEFWEFLRSQQKVLTAQPNHFLGHAYRLYAERKPTLVDNGALLIGDAAGLAYPHSGEGIRPAVESAIIGADVIAQSNPEFNREALAMYQSRLIERFGLPKPYQAANWLPAAWLQSLAARLLANRWFAKNIVIDNWFLHRKQAALDV
jgi:flavin-dependent dehydrogenase